MFKFRKRMQPPVPIEDIIHNHNQANPIRHYRLGNDCNCSMTDLPKTLKIDSTKDNCSREHTQEHISLKKVRNSGGNLKQTQSNSQYLKSKAMTYDQKKYHYHKSDADTANNKYACLNGFDSNGNETNCCTTWKPNNKYFVKHGAVSSSTNTNKIKYHNIESTASSMSNFDHSTVVAHAYSGRTAAPFTLKSKMQTPICGMFRKKGSKKYC